MSLPVQLTKNPLVSVVFEIRFDSTVPMSSVLPGLLYTKLGCTTINKTPHADIPEIVRQQNDQFAYVPVITMDWGEYQVNIGDKVLMLACSMPYLGWEAFSMKIHELISHFSASGFPVRVERFSLKYVDLFEYQNINEIKPLLNFNVLIGGEGVDLEYVQLRSEKRIENTVTIMQFIGQAEAHMGDGTSKFGLLIDIDCIKPIDNIPLEKFNIFHDELDSLHLKTKKEFFNFISKEGLVYLGAIYA